jgi:hypothetical protein
MRLRKKISHIKEQREQMDMRDSKINANYKEPHNELHIVLIS